jgi:1-acyl-sn-glycerol-3-phosphate acyltransferase
VRAGVRGVRDWMRRGRQLFSTLDILELTNPVVLVEKFTRYAFARHKRPVPASEPEARDLDYVRFIVDLFRALGKKYFRLEVRGIDNVPAEGPVLLVANHNGAFLPSDGFFTAVALTDRFGPARAPYALAHDFLFYDERLRRAAMRIGALRAGHESARRVFERGGVVLVYPGSELDVFRPWRDRHRIVLGGRKGFLRLAIRERVPIVPVVCAGTHEQLVILTRGDRLAKLLRTHAWLRADVFPIVLSVPWGLTSGFVPYVPLPAQTTLSFGKPITWPSLKPADAEDPAVLERCYGEVERTMQGMLDELAKGRRAFLGAPRAKAGLQPGVPKTHSSSRSRRATT